MEVLFASYSTIDYAALFEELAETANEVKFLSIYGSEDEVLNQDAYQEHKNNLPNMKEVIIEGGCHAFFGNYGAQEGDGTPTITDEEQIKQTIEAIKEFVVLL